MALTEANMANYIPSSRACKRPGRLSSGCGRRRPYAASELISSSARERGVA